MRINIEIDDHLLTEAQRVAGTESKQATVQFALEELVRRTARRSTKDLFGQVEWDGDLEASRDPRRA